MNTDRMQPVLVYGLNSVEVCRVRDAAVLTMKMVPHVGAVSQATDIAPGYACFHIHLDRAVWPELKAVLDRVNWIQVKIIKAEK